MISRTLLKRLAWGLLIALGYYLALCTLQLIRVLWTLDHLFYRL